MRILHLADLHFGKRVGNLSLLEDQKYINEQIYACIDHDSIDAVLIAGDVYDKSIPSEEAVNLFDDFLVNLAKRKLPVLIIAGNHDSVERLSFGDRLMDLANIYISPRYDGNVKKVTLQDEFGDLNFYLMPFVKPVHVQHYFPEKEISSYSQALSVAIEEMKVDPSQRNIILSHQFVTGASKDGSEDELSLGGSMNVDASVYDVFDYVALGHIHRPQKLGKETVRYSGSPIKFSFNEGKQKKGLTIIEIQEKGNVSIEVQPVNALRDFITIKGNYEDLKKGVEGVRAQDFVHVILTDEDDIPNAFSNLSIVYPNIQSMEYKNRRTQNDALVDGTDVDTQLHPVDLFKEFYELRNNNTMNEEQFSYIQQLIEEIWED